MITPKSVVTPRNLRVRCAKSRSALAVSGRVAASTFIRVDALVESMPMNSSRVSRNTT
jgi:hypothetical protein